MSADPNKKSLRQFQCRDVLWDTFEQMARELECSVDYLINEAMKQYARQRSYGAKNPASQRPGEPGSNPGSIPVAPGSVAPGSLPRPPMPPPGRLPAVQRPPQAAPHGAAMPVPPVPPPPVPPPPTVAQTTPHGRVPPPPPPPPHSAATGRSFPPPPPHAQPLRPALSAPPPIPASQQTTRQGPPPIPALSEPAAVPQSASQAGVLSVHYRGDRYIVNKDRFVIGRGKHSSDLTLKDPNVSRQHAMVERQNGMFFLVDMGSTNGVEYNGQRIARKPIAEGDTFRICDHELFFTYR